VYYYITLLLAGSETGSRAACVTRWDYRPLRSPAMFTKAAAAAAAVHDTTCCRDYNESST